MTTTDTITSLCAAIDAGDDSLLPLLADALEDAGRSREAEGLRLIEDGGGRAWTWREPG